MSSPPSTLAPQAPARPASFKLRRRRGGSTPGRFAGPLPHPAPNYRWGRADLVSTIIIGLVAFITRIAGLSAPTSEGTPIFDEKHYVPQAWDMVLSWNNWILGGIESNPGYGLVVHPPLAKQIIALAEMVFGYTPLGWRIASALFGTATVLFIMSLARRLSSSWQVAAFAGILAVCDGVLLVSSKFGMLDIFQVCFIVAAAWALVRDHQQVHARCHRAWVRGELGSSDFGPRFGFRWWRFAAGVALGLAVAVKWSGLYYMAFFGLASVFGDLALRRRYGVGKFVTGTLLRDVPAALASLVALPLALYLWSWRAWFASETSVYRHALSDGTIASSSFLSHLPEPVAGFIYYHLSVLKFHASLTSSAGHSHPWDSKPWAWLVGARPILYFSSTDLQCSGGVECRRMLFLFGTPIIWWLVVPALLWAMWRVFVGRDYRFVIPLVGFAAGFVPWVVAIDRQMYFFYAAAFIPFVIVIFALILGQVIGRGKPLKLLSKIGPPLPSGTVAAIVYLAAVVAMFVYFSPLFYGYTIPESWYQSMMWLPSWT